LLGISGRRGIALAVLQPARNVGGFWTGELMAQQARQASGGVGRFVVLFVSGSVAGAGGGFGGSIEIKASGAISISRGVSVWAPVLVGAWQRDRLAITF